MRQASDFKERAKALRITHWPHHPCAFCGVWTQFIFDGGEAYYSSACGCSSFQIRPSRVTWEYVADFYNMQTQPEVIAKMDKFWHFDEEVTPSTEVDILPWSDERIEEEARTVLYYGAMKHEIVDMLKLMRDEWAKDREELLAKVAKVEGERNSAIFTLMQLNPDALAGNLVDRLQENQGRKLNDGK